MMLPRSPSGGGSGGGSGDTDTGIVTPNNNKKVSEHVALLSEFGMEEDILPLHKKLIKGAVTGVGFLSDAYDLYVF